MSPVPAGEPVPGESSVGSLRRPSPSDAKSAKTQLPAAAKVCFKCATPVSAPGSVPRFGSPETYTPKHLAERIINSKAALDGERKQVTVPFADVRDRFSTLCWN